MENKNDTSRNTLAKRIAAALVCALLVLAAWGCSAPAPEQNDGDQSGSGQTATAQPEGNQATDTQAGNSQTADTQSGSSQTAGTQSDTQNRADDDNAEDGDQFVDTLRTDDGTAEGAQATGVSEDLTVHQGGSYTAKDDVALYVHLYGHLPDNYISKTKARAAGWVSSEGNLQEVCPGMSIGGSRYYNDDGTLPQADGRRWTECDIDYHGGYRGEKRIIFSNDGLIYYTGDHYKTFTRIF